MFVVFLSVLGLLRGCMGGEGYVYINLQCNFSNFYSIQPSPTF